MLTNELTHRVGHTHNIQKRTNTQGGDIRTMLQNERTNRVGTYAQFTKRTNTHNFGTSRALYIDYSILYKKHDIDVVLYMIGIILTENNGNI